MQRQRVSRVWSIVASSCLVASAATAQELFPLGGVRAGASARALIAADLDEDGYLDFAVANASNASSSGNPGMPLLTVFRNDHVRGLTELASQPMSGASSSNFDGYAAAADFDEDGHVDVAYAGTNSFVRVVFGDGDGAFGTATFPVTHNVRCVRAADANDDGNQDLIVSSSSGMSVEIWLGDGAGGFALGQTLNGGGGQLVNDAEVLDLDRDGEPDLVVGALFQSGPRVFFGVGGGVFSTTATTYPLVGTSVNDCLRLDVDGDGNSDVITLHSVGSVMHLGVFLSTNGAGLLAPFTIALPAFAYDVAVADVDRDGRRDLVVAGGTELDVLLGTGGSGAAMFAAPLRYTRGYAAGAVEAADFDHDAFTDVAVLHGGQGLIVSYGDDHGALLQTNEATIAAPARGLATGDVDFDGDVDAVLAVGAGTQAKGFLCYRNDGAGALAAPVFTAFGAAGEPGEIDVGDLDGSGALDLVSARVPSSAPGAIDLWLGSGSGSFAPGASLSATVACDAARIADLDGDTVNDVIARSYLDSELVVWRGLGGGSFSAALQTATLGHVYDFALGYVNGDALLDVVTVSKDGLPCLVYLNTGGGTFALGAFLQIPSWRPYDVAVGDVSGDGIADIVCHATPASGPVMLLYYQGLGGGSFAPGVLAEEQEGFDVRVADIDGDGKLDVCSSFPTLVAVTPSAGAGAFATTRTFASNGAGTSFAPSWLAPVDLNGDARTDFVQLAPKGSTEALLAVLLHRGDDASATIYCTAKTNSSGCGPSIGWSGSPSTSAPNGFVVTCSDVVNKKSGLLFYGLAGPLGAPFLGGTYCVKPPTKRLSVLNSGGSLPPIHDCSGSFAFDFNAYIAAGSGPATLLVPGTNVHAQWWARDPQHPDAFKVQLSNALSFVVGL
ncbi:MAG: VCBS repeat-containing protein [Planctomycetes bacterium]|nr:VCBS repeat-containing protein [Planctomycetota bacterium]